MQEFTRKATATAALFEALAYLFGFSFMLSVLNPLTDESWSSAQRLTFLIEHKVLYQIWILVIYVLFGLALVILTAGLNKQLAKHHDLLDSCSPIFGYIWSGLVIASGMITTVGLEQLTDNIDQDSDTAVTIWSTIEILQNGLGGGVEVVGGVWVLLISLQARRQSAFSNWLIYLGIIVGLAGILTLIPGLSALGAVFGLLQIVWFVGVAWRLYFGNTIKRTSAHAGLSGL